MRIIFITVYFNLHLKELCDELYNLYKDDFVFMEMGYNKTNFEKSRILPKNPPYVIQIDAITNVSDFIVNADVLIVGSVDYKIIKKRIKKDRLTFLYQERPLRKGLEPVKYLFRYFKWHYRYGRLKNCYVLAASFYTSVDYSNFNLFLNRCLRFGYFPTRYKGIVKPFNDRENTILFCGRLIDLKHPEIFIKLFNDLTVIVPNIKAIVVGDGPLLSEIQKMITDNKNITMTGYLPNEDVLEVMNNSKFLIFCSDQREGWGAVLNEAMSCGCVPIVNNKIGSAGFLIKNAINGYVYNNYDDLLEITIKAINEPTVTNISKNARDTIFYEWNGEVAASRFKKLLDSKINKSLFKSGPLSIIE